MTTTEPVGHRVAPALTTHPGFFRAPFAAATYRGVAQLAVGWTWALTAGLLVVIAVVTAAAMVPVLGLGLVLLPATLALARAYGDVERARLAAQTGVVVPAPARRRPAQRRWTARLWAASTDPVGWRATAYAAVVLVLTSVYLAFVVALAAGAVGGVVLAVRFLLDGGTGDASTAGALLLLLGALAVVAAPWFAAFCAQAGTLTTLRLARALLGPSAAAEARAAQAVAESEARVAESAAAAAARRADVLTETRAAALEAADTERRRIERDLHDGAQQRLVALGVTLGTARRAAERDPAAAVAALEHAHGEVKETLAELRDLVRGIHPAVLSDRGLDAALSALAARSPVLVRVETSGLEAAGTTAQAAAYFVVAEALTNVAKHAGASRAHVRADVVVPEASDDPAVAGPTLRVEVTDDGRGGAGTAPGGGLAGLRGRVAALDGTFDLTSPADAGTRLTVELPCAS
ncbi:signal transduction histidine kinase [Isoptericola sp. CG 20/1183]|uniref:histidine kinase n=1 Tax=Isoptericola halotolerans TaxID=300560 RepID=A0ABX5EAX1_9MICO|nr:MULTISPECIES: histidine kinase [Isoptericola]PRZ03046.1 signal transduction histidine kinase [Isoptericola sp. CG 20/1183]PRZ03300.1 signal transduction histidine kinase [Isoptericola halotolerans]